MFGFESLTGGGGLSMSSSAAADQTSNTRQGGGAVNIGGLTLGSPGDTTEQTLIKGGLIVGGALAVVWAWKRL